MEVNKFQVTNVGQFTHIEIPLASIRTSSSNITVFVDNNGTGKTLLLKSLATSLSWFVARLRREIG